MKLFITIVISFALGIFFYVLPIGLDTGMIEWKQPNGVTFIGRNWGDEFESWMETSDGYRFVMNYTDGYYYYAVLDEEGDFTASNNKVAIDAPLAESFKLKRSAEKKAEIDSLYAEFEADLEQTRLQYEIDMENCKNLDQPWRPRIAVLLVEYPDTTHYIDTSLVPTRPEGYLRSDFTKMLFDSTNNWFGGALGQPPSQHPEGDRLFGSMRDYYEQQSLSSVLICGEVINPDTLPDIPKWLKADSGKIYYHNQTMAQQVLQKEAIKKAKLKGWLFGDINNPGNILNANGKPYSGIIIVYAGKTLFSGALHPNKQSNRYIMSEQNHYQSKPFAHIGVHTHEAGHLLFGFPDVYKHAHHANNFGLMTYGAWNGPNSACPSGVEPGLRIDWG